MSRIQLYSAGATDGSTRGRRMYSSTARNPVHQFSSTVSLSGRQTHHGRSEVGHGVPTWGDATRDNGGHTWERTCSAEPSCAVRVSRSPDIRPLASFGALAETARPHRCRRRFVQWMFWTGR
eukprot:876997-Prymnesium_polylepis.1